MSSGGASGQGITVAFATSSFTASLVFVGRTEQTRGALEDSHLGLASGSEMTFVPADLIDAGEFVIRFLWNQSFSTFPPITGAAESITITYPLKTGETTGATLAGTGFLTRSAGPDVEINATGVMQGEATVKWNGKTGPTYTAGS